MDVEPTCLENRSSGRFWNTDCSFEILVVQRNKGIMGNVICEVLMPNLCPCAKNAGRRRRLQNGEQRRMLKRCSRPQPLSRLSRKSLRVGVCTRHVLTCEYLGWSDGRVFT
jgi:hypothetical protein